MLFKTKKLRFYYLFPLSLYPTIMKKVYSVDLINSFFSKQEATELILGLINYKIELHSNKLFSTQVKVNKLESYRKMRVGNMAPNFELVGDVLKNGVVVKNTVCLADINAKYKLIIFGGSWCNQCKSEMIQLLPRYNNWKSKGLEVVFISLDTDKKEFENFTAPFPFYSACDYKKWETQAAKNYYVSSSPTIFLLDSDNKIILRPPTVASLDSWLD